MLLAFLAAAPIRAAAQTAETPRYADQQAAQDPQFENRLSAELDALFAHPAAKPAAPGAKRPKHHPRDATMLLRDLRLNFDHLRPDTQLQYAPLLLRPNNYTGSDFVKWGPLGSYTEATVSSTRFVVHYVTAPSDNPSTATPEFAQQILDTLDYVADVENGSLGWPLPPSDAFYTPPADNGGDGRYDVYLADIGGIPDNPLFGYVMAEQQVLSAPGVAYTSYMVLDNDYSPNQFDNVSDPLAVMRVTVAHEYNHSCQYALNVNDPETWFYESTATHLEDVVYNSVNDYYRYLPGFFDWPDYSLRYFTNDSNGPANLHQYGAAVWNHYLARRFGNSLELGIWEDTATGGYAHPTLIQTMQTRLTGLGTSLADEFGRFAAWNLLTGSRADASYYPEGDAWPLVFVPAVQRYAALPAARSVSDTEGPQTLAASYVVFTPGPETAGSLVFDFQGLGDTDWRLWWVGHRGSDLFLVPVALDPNDHATATIDNNQNYDWIAFVPSNVSTTGSITTRSPLSYQATLDTTTGASDSWLLAP